MTAPTRVRYANRDHGHPLYGRVGTVFARNHGKGRVHDMGVRFDDGTWMCAPWGTGARLRRDSVADSYLRFEEIPTINKTKAWGVLSRLHGDRLGAVRWFARWRQYAFFPEGGTIWNSDCLAEVAAFIVRHKADRNEGREEASCDA